MADIPADIMALATELLDGAYQFPDGTYATGAYEAIAKAILAERERCADVALNHFRGEGYNSYQRTAGATIYATILCGPEGQV